jgi:hypothetical protein
MTRVVRHGGEGWGLSDDAGRTLARRRLLQLSGAVAAAVPISGPWAESAAASDAQVGPRVITVDAGEVTGTFNRALFSCTGYAQLMIDSSPMALDTYRLLNPVGTQARIEVMMDQASPAPGVFRPDRMLRFVDNTDDAYLAHVESLGMEPVLLCAYNTPWLTRTGRLNEAPTDPQAWADIVAQVVWHVNGEGSDPGYRLRVRYVEVWNEPNLDQFWLGSDEEYAELFRRTADTIHARFPGVMVGGPVFSPGIEGYYDYGKAFVDAAGEHMDFFVYHSYGDSPDKIVADMRLWEDYIRTHTSKADPVLMVTESESFFASDALKAQDLLLRQFSLIENGQRMLGWHQFCLLEYQEGWYTFGLIYRDGSVFARNYWPYWIFRDAAGSTVRVGPRTGAAMPGEHMVATRDDDRGTVNLVYWRDPAVVTGSQVTRVQMTLPADGRDRVLIVSTVSGTSDRVASARRVSGRASRLNETLRVDPGTAVSLTLLDAREATTPWLGLDASDRTVPVGSTFTATACLVNTTPRRLSGALRLVNLPAGWQSRIVSGVDRFADVDTGEAVTATWQVQATSATQADVAYHVHADLAGTSPTHSIPVRITAVPAAE